MPIMDLLSLPPKFLTGNQTRNNSFPFQNIFSFLYEKVVFF